MTSSRKVQERAIVFPSGDLTLEGLYIKGVRGPGVVVGAPHPLYGGSMHAPACMEIAYSAARVGFPALRFNYRGVGGSQGERRPVSVGPIEPASVAAFAGESADYEAAMEELCLTAEEDVLVAAGYSFGAAMALEVALRSERVGAVLLASPPTRLFSFDAIPELRVPVLVVGGEGDEYLDWDLLDGLAARAPRARVERVPEAEHFWQRGLGALGTVCRDWLQRLL